MLNGHVAGRRFMDGWLATRTVDLVDPANAQPLADRPEWSVSCVDDAKASLTMNPVVLRF